jgi:hypothetical protein
VNATPHWQSQGVALCTYLTMDSLQFGVSTEVTLPTGPHALTEILRRFVVLTLRAAELVLGTGEWADEPVGRWVGMGLSEPVA